MSYQELYQQKQQAKLDEWKAELDKLKAQATGANADARIAMKQRAETLQKQIEAGQTELSKLRESSGEAWEAIRAGVDSAWDSLSQSFREARSKFNY